MNILIACDKFKGSLDAQRVCNAIARGIRKSNPTAPITKMPIADGGDGTMHLLRDVLSLKVTTMDTLDPLNRPIRANYYTSDDTAFIELAEASGIARLDTSELNPLITHNTGTGLMIKDALDNGYSQIVLGIGGSCTTEAGLSIAHQLGYTFLDHEGSGIVPTGGNLRQIVTIVAPKDKMTFDLTILRDVDNPLYGSNGAAHVYGPQKGANEQQVEHLDQGLQHIAQLIKSALDKDISTLKGGGAAGGIAAGLYGLCVAEIISGFDYLSNLFDLKTKIKAADLIITGEGRLDSQSLQGKVIGSIAQICTKYQKPLVAVVGSNQLTQSEISQSGITQIYTIMDRATDLDDAMMKTEQYLEDIGERVM